MRWWTRGLLGLGTVGLGAIVAIGCGSDSEEFSAKPGAGTGGGAGTGTGGTAGSATGGAAGASTGGAAGTAGGAAGAATGGSAGDGGPGDAAGGAAGADASDAPVCTDLDNDGKTTCDGDCDDSDPLNYPDNTELCGDSADNDCDGAPDENCGGLGTFVSATVGSDANPGSKALPVATINKGLQNAQTILQSTGGSVDVFVAEGHYSEKVKLVQSINLLGGYTCLALPCSWARDPKTYDSAILDTDFEGVLADSTITRRTRFDGFRVMGRTGNPTGSPWGTVAISLAGGTPTLTNNKVVAGASQGGSGQDGNSVGIGVFAPSNDVLGALIDSNSIEATDSLNGSIGVVLDARTFPGVGRSYAVVTRNTIRGGKGRSSTGIAAWQSGNGTVFRNNDIFADEATDSTSSAWGIAGGGIFLADGNRINLDRNDPPRCASSSQWCGGIRSYSATATITNNVVFGARSALSAGVYLSEVETPAGVVILNSNYIDGGGGSSGSSSRSAAVAMSISGCCGNQTWVGRIINNVLVGGTGTNRFGVYEEKTSSRVSHPEALQNNDFFIANPTSADALYQLWNGSSAQLLTTATAINGLTGLGPVGGNFSADPLVDATFHLGSGSPCIDVGTATDAPAADFEGEARPKGAGFDVGADEAQ